MSKQGREALYLYNESVKEHFDFFVRKICESMGMKVDSGSPSDLSNVTWVDMSSKILKIADYESIEKFYKYHWISQIEDWLKKTTNPGLIVVDSFSRIGRRYIPQLWVQIEALIDGLDETFKERKVNPIVILVHQKSQSSREKNDESVVGGEGITHSTDVTLVFRKRDVDTWVSRDFGLPIGSNLYTLWTAKDRYGTAPLNENVLNMANGQITLGEELLKLADKVKASKPKKFTKGTDEVSLDEVFRGADPTL